MRIVVHKLVVVLMIFGLVGGAMSVASSARINNDSLRLSSISNATGTLALPDAATQSWHSHSQMTNCNMTHPPINSTGMSCCGCFPSGANNLCIAPMENKVNAFGKLDVKGASRAPSSLLKPPRA